MLNNIQKEIEIVGSTGAKYVLTHYDSYRWHCTCLGFQKRGYCKHKRRYFKELVTNHMTAKAEPRKDKYTDEDFLYILKHCSIDQWDSVQSLIKEYKTSSFGRLSWYGNDEKIAEGIQRNPRGIKTAMHKLAKDEERLRRILSKATNIENDKRHQRDLQAQRRARQRKIEERRSKTLEERIESRQAVKNRKKQEVESNYQSPLGTTYWSILYELDSNGDMKYHVKNGKTSGNHPITRTLNWGPLVCFVEEECESKAHEISRQEFGSAKLPIRRQGGMECFGAFDSVQEAVDACYLLGRKTAETLGLTLQDYRKGEV